MSHIFSLGDMDNFTEKINLDDLYEKKREHDLAKLEIFNKLLNRIHTKIRMTSRQKIDEQFCWFVVPEMMLGVPRYNHSDCVAYLVDKLKDNGFYVKYTHPNLLLISWKHWIPDYVRMELKKKANISVDGYGNVIKDKKEEEVKNFLMPGVEKAKSKKDDFKHRPIDDDNSLGIYSLDLFKPLKKD